MQQDIARPQRLQQRRRCGALADAQARVDAQCGQPHWQWRGRRQGGNCGPQRGQQGALAVSAIASRSPSVMPMPWQSSGSASRSKAMTSAAPEAQRRKSAEAIGQQYPRDRNAECVVVLVQ